MDELRMNVETDPADADVARLGEGLTEHALPITGARGFRPLAVVVRDRELGLAGGAYGRINWSWLHVSLLWVAAAHRGRGWGRQLLEAMETAARERGCRQAHLDTFSYQAPGFYEGQGYTVFARLEDYPPGHERIFLRKTLARPG